MASQRPELDTSHLSFQSVLSQGKILRPVKSVEVILHIYSVVKDPQAA